VNLLEGVLFLKIYDISMDVFSGMAVYRNNQELQPKIEIMRDFESGVRQSRIILDLHTGTHMDAPLHMVRGGATTDSFRVENMVVPCRVLDLMDVEDGITAADLEKFDIQKGEFILFKTRNSLTDSFDPNFVYLKEDGARYLADIPILGVGTDALGIERSQPGHETHVTLLKKGILILEGLRLKEVPAGRYTLLAAPVKLRNLEASPVRALLLPDHFTM